MTSTIARITNNRMMPPPTSTGSNHDAGAADTPPDPVAPAETVGDGETVGLPAICCAVGDAPAAVETSGFTSGYVVGSTANILVILTMP